MNTKLDCEIIRDLLPSYVDGLTSEVTNKAVEAHLVDCTGCTETFQRMKEPEGQEQLPVTEVDYLKKVRRHTRNTVLWAVGAAILLIALLLIRLFVVGNEAWAAGVNYNASVSGNVVYFNGSLTDSGTGVSHASFTEEDGVVTVLLYTAPKTFLNSGEFVEKYEAKEPVKEIRFNGLTVWENGTAISRTAAQLFANKNPYVGDMSANGGIAAILGIRDQFGNYTNELQTSQEPYGWTLLLEPPVAAEEESTARDIMTADSYVMLATINNLGYVTWEYQTERGQEDFTVTVQDASAFVGLDIKQCAETASDLQALLQSLSIKWSGVRETLQEDGTFRLAVKNESDADIRELMVNYYLDGKLIGTRIAGNANGSDLAGHSSVDFEFVPSDFPEGTNAVGLSRFSFDLAVVGKDGAETPVRKGIGVGAKYAWTFFYTLTGSYEDGFTLNEG